MGEGFAELARLVESELTRRAPAAAERAAAEIRRRHGDGLAAVIFYGSCLRRGVHEGVLDFYALVDGYRDAYPSSRLLAAVNAAFPPNVFYLQLPWEGETLRAKYALLTLSDFQRGAEPGSLRSGVWARFCQPVRAVYLRDAAAQQEVVRGCATSVLTAVRSIVPLFAADPDDGIARFGSEDLWQRIFRETYAREMRTETAETIHSLYRSDVERYDRAAQLALAELEGRAWRHELQAGGGIALRQDAGARRRLRRAWRLRRPLAKLVYAAGLFKSAFTFGDWFPYVLWKLERHSGARLEPSERQRRHPLIWGWPLLWRALRRRALR